MNVLKLRVENSEELLNTSAYAAGAVIRVERSLTGGGAGYSEIGTVPLVSGTSLYTYYDQSAAAGSWYRSRYSNAGNTNRSDYGAEFQATTELISYCSIYDVKQRIGLAASDTTDDEELLQHIEHAAGFIESKVGRSLYPDPITSYDFDGFDAVWGGRCLLIPQGIRSVTSISVAGSTGAVKQDLVAGDWVIRPLPQDRDPGWPATQLWLTDVASWRTWPGGYSNITVVGAFGWAAVPREVEAVALRLVIGSWKGRASGGGDRYSIGTEAGERIYERMLSWEDKETLEAYESSVLVR